MKDYAIKDSGERQQFSSGMVRDTQDGKTRYDLVFDGPMFGRWAEHLTKGAQKYAIRNWMQAATQEELERFRASAVRHFVQWLQGEDDEDHAAAVFFNINGFEYVKQQLDAEAAAAAALSHPGVPCVCSRLPVPHFHDENGGARTPLTRLGV